MFHRNCIPNNPKLEVAQVSINRKKMNKYPVMDSHNGILCICIKGGPTNSCNLWINIKNIRLRERSQTR